MGEQRGGLTDVGGDRARARGYGKQGSCVCDHHRVVVDIADPARRNGAADGARHAVRGGKPASNVDELPQPRLPREVADSALGEGAVGLDEPGDDRGLQQRPLGYFPVHCVVVLTAEEIVVHPGGTWGRCIEPRPVFCGGTTPHTSRNRPDLWPVEPGRSSRVPVSLLHKGGGGPPAEVQHRPGGHGDRHPSLMATPNQNVDVPFRLRWVPWSAASACIRTSPRAWFCEGSSGRRPRPCSPPPSVTSTRTNRSMCRADSMMVPSRRGRA